MWTSEMKSGSIRYRMNRLLENAAVIRKTSSGPGISGGLSSTALLGMYPHRSESPEYLLGQRKERLRAAKAKGNKKVLRKLDREAY